MKIEHTNMEKHVSMQKAIDSTTSPNKTPFLPRKFSEKKKKELNHRLFFSHLPNRKQTPIIHKSKLLNVQIDYNFYQLPGKITKGMGKILKEAFPFFPLIFFPGTNQTEPN